MANPRPRPRLYRWGSLPAAASRTISLPAERLSPRLRWAHELRGSLVLGARQIFDHELVLVLDGVGVYRCAGQAPAPLQAGSLLLIRPFVHHAIESGSGDRGRHVAIHFDPCDLPHADEPGHRRPYAVLPQGGWAWPSAPLLVALDGDLAARIQRIPPAFAEGGLGLLRASALLGEVLADCLMPSMGADDVRIAAALARIDRQLDHDIAVASLAADCGLSVSRFRSVFRSVVGRAPAAEIRRRRLRRGAELLAGTRLPIATVAARCGFTDPFHFSRAFRRATGLSPRDWRRHGRSRSSGPGPLASSRSARPPA